MNLLRENSRILHDFKDSNGKYVKSVTVNYVSYKTKAYAVWLGLKKRTNKEGIYHDTHPSYKDCAISENFKNFQFFAEWCQRQVGYGLDDYQIDKDLLVEGNRVYSEDVCVFIPRSLNMFLVDSKASRGEYPRGVTWNKVNKNFMAYVQITKDGKKRLHYLGSYDSVEDASNAYKMAKESEARRWYDRLTQGEFDVDSRVIERMRTWCLPDCGEE